jgi:MATE family multidrug resistance protein
VAAIVAAVLLLVPAPLLRIFTDDVGVLVMGATLLAICAAFQPFDGVQAVATGALRGLGDTTTPMLLNLAGHWLVGLPLGYTLCFVRGWGLPGLWTGLATGLLLVGLSIAVAWHRRSGAPILVLRQGATG